ncbi:MAG: NAD(P)-dependent oxidoreductase [Nitrospiraceae bacterium]|nr:NAD(P)-dependent oxidoreductase [Nitrospiraceae bacterium]
MGTLEGKRVLVTGGSGVIGRELLQRLASKGARVLSADRLPLPFAIEGAASLQMDLADHNLKELADFDPQIIFHLAAAFERSEETPDFWPVNWHDNILLSHRMVELASKLPNLESFIFASSYLVYAPDLYLSSEYGQIRLLKESDPKAPRNLCGAAKFYTESELQFLKTYLKPSVRVVNARIYRVYGRGSKDVISRWVRAALSGWKIELYNKQNKFDYIFAGEVAEGLVNLCESQKAEGAVNLASGRARAVEEVISIINRVLPGNKFEVLDTGSRQRFESSCADLSRLVEFTGWKPAVHLETGIKLIADYESGPKGSVIS